LLSETAIPYAVKAGQPIFKQKPTKNNPIQTARVLAGIFSIISIMTTVDTAVNIMVGLRRRPNSLSETHPPPIAPIKPPMHGILATKPILITSKPRSLTKYRGIQVNNPYSTLTIIKYARQSPRIFFEVNKPFAVSIGAIFFTRMILSSQVNLSAIKIFSRTLLL